MTILIHCRISAEEFIDKFNAFGSQGGTHLVLVPGSNSGIAFPLIIDADAAEAALDKQQLSPDKDKLMPQQASLRGFLEVLAAQIEHEKSGSITPIRRFTR